MPLIDSLPAEWGQPASFFIVLGKFCFAFVKVKCSATISSALPAPAAASGMFRVCRFQA
jgi:hypothetical protein